LLVEQGEYVVPGQPVADVIRLDRMKLFVELSGRELALLDADVTVRIVPDAEPETVYPATLHHIAPRADPVSRKFRLEVHLDNPDGALRSGSFAECRLTADKSRRIVTLPSSAVIHRHGRDYCHVAVNEGGHLRARVRPIETRPVPDLLDRVEVTGGLTPGERIVIGSQAELRDGAAIVTLGTEHAASER
jgi:RND family efflux transporter MFP subunit